METVVDTEAVKKWLRRYESAMRKSEILEERLSEMEAKAFNPKSAAPNGMPHGGGNPVDTLGSTVAKLEHLRTKLEASKKAAYALYNEIDSTIEMITGTGKDAENRKGVLQMRYLDGMSWEEVNSAMFGGNEDFLDREEAYLRRVFYIHGGALADLVPLIPEQAG